MIQENKIKKVYPLRDRKRSKTRATLVTTCDKLLSQYGYKALTMQAVADEAGIHVQTLYKHFPTKFDLASTASCEGLRRRMLNRNVDTFSEWSGYVIEKSIEISSYDKGKLFLGTIDITLGNENSEQLSLAIGNEYTDILAKNIAKDFQMNQETDLLPSIIGNIIYTASTHNTLEWHRMGGKTDLVESCKKMLSNTKELIDAVISSQNLST
ncbi:MAG: TetR/AcrR family transcriptional regulator [Gammaproteobacteria bacterium]|tara:strand:- start:9444 stop:10076 length:633 start_codon:yes stop_codon:yes gene_type:complete